MEVTTEHQLIAEFDPYTPEQHFIRVHREDQDKESIAGQRYLTSTEGPDLDERATTITGAQRGNVNKDGHDVCDVAYLHSLIETWT